jgi:hypothetical protein
MFIASIVASITVGLSILSVIIFPIAMLLVAAYGWVFALKVVIIDAISLAVAASFCIIDQLWINKMYDLVKDMYDKYISAGLEFPFHTKNEKDKNDNLEMVCDNCAWLFGLNHKNVDTKFGTLSFIKRQYPYLKDIETLRNLPKDGEYHFDFLKIKNPKCNNICSYEPEKILKSNLGRYVDFHIYDEYDMNVKDDFDTIFMAKKCNFSYIDDDWENVKSAFDFMKDYPTNKYKPYILDLDESKGA